MTWSKEGEPINKGDEGSYAHPHDSHKRDEQLPVVVDPETGHQEVLGKGRIVVLGKQGVERVVHVAEDGDDVLDRLVTSGDLTFGA